jgi:DNA-binding NarL/FixJ family response regulator
MKVARHRLLMADDHTLVVAGIRRLLEDEFDLVGTVEDGRALLVAAKQLMPDIVLLDISMPLLNGIEACRQMVKTLPKIPVIFLTMHADAVYVEEAMRAGAAGYLLKSSAAAELSDAIRAVARGDKYVTHLVAWKGPSSRESRSDGGRESLQKLTPRQHEVLQLIAEGKSIKEIANLLAVTEKTIDFHKSSIKRELKLNSTAAMTTFAIRHRIITL